MRVLFALRHPRPNAQFVPGRVHKGMPPLLEMSHEIYARKQARRGLLAFTTYTKPDYTVNWHHEALAAALDRLRETPRGRLMVFMPPQHGKSELVSRRFPAYVLGRSPDTRLIQASHTYDLACSMNRDVQRIMTDDPYAKLFPETSLAERFSRDKIAARRTMDLFELPGHRGSLRSAGVGNSIAGNPADGAIIDDPFGKREDADSPTMRQKVWDWFTNDLYTRLSAEAWIVLTHTRWHRDDLAGRLLRKMADRSADQWEILCLPAVKEEGPGDTADHRQPGDVLWPAFKSPADLDIIRQQDAKTFAALYQQNPTDASTADWAVALAGDWMWAKPDQWPAKFDIGVVCVDASKGKSDKQGDYTAIVYMGIARGLLWIDAKIERIPLDQVVEKRSFFATSTGPTWSASKPSSSRSCSSTSFAANAATTSRPAGPST